MNWLKALHLTSQDKNLWRQIASRKIPCYFISPHFDDAVLSAGALMMDLSGKTQVTVINVFTKPGQNNTLSAKSFIKQCGSETGKNLFVAREKEDKKVLSEMNIKVVNLGLLDALWRTKGGKVYGFLGKIVPEFAHIYPTYRWHVKKGKISTYDRDTTRKLTKELLRIIKPGDFIFCPIGIGGHVDHLLVKKVCEQSFENLIFWSDYPYNIRQDKRDLSINKTEMASLLYRKDIAVKKNLVKGYKTQYNALFSDTKFRLVPEKFYYKKYA